MRCDHCDKKFKNKKIYTNHIEKRVCHPRVCAICSKSFNTDYALKRHEESKDHKNRIKNNPSYGIESKKLRLEEIKKEAKNLIKEIEIEEDRLEIKKETMTNQAGGQVINFNNCNFITVQLVIDPSTIPEDVTKNIARKLTTTVKYGSDALEAIGKNAKYLCDQTIPAIHYSGEDTSIVIRGGTKYVTENAIPAIKSALASCIMLNEDSRITDHLDDLKYSLTFPNTTEERKFDNPDRPYLQPPEKVDEAVRKGIRIPEPDWDS